MADLKQLADAIIAGKKAVAENVTREALAEGMDPNVILDQGLVAGMNVVGTKFKANDFYVPEVLVAARAMKAAMELLRPHLKAAGGPARARVCIGTVQGDLHDIGKNLVAMMLEGAGYEIVDLGVDVPAAKFREKALAENAQIVCLSALLTTTMPSMRDTVAAFEQAGKRDSVRVLVGGAPVTQAFCDQIGADGYAPDAASAVDRVKELLSAKAA